LNDQAVRNLAHLEHSASSSRVLNLLRVHRSRGTDPAYAESPFFKSQVLNHSIVLKHRLRRHERDLFFDGRQTATKVIIPIDRQDLKLGGRSVFVDQFNYDNVMEGMFGGTWLTDPQDRELLAIIDQLPSLDPFLLREQLRRHNRHPARCYFEISNGDMARMFKFVEHEIQKLIELSFRDTPDAVDDVKGSRLVQKILSDSVDAETEPLRLYDQAFASLIDGRPQAFRDFLLGAPGMFCELGERLGAVSHIVSFWNIRFPKGHLPVVTGPELMDIFADFESSLAFAETASATAQLRD